MSGINLLICSHGSMEYPVLSHLFSCVVALYLLFSPVGVVGGFSALFAPLIGLIVILNAFSWWKFIARG
jgi:SSS family solute:Na+ symporter